MKKVICSEHAPAAIGPYAQAIAANGIVFTSGQLPIDPATGAFPEGIAAQTKQSLTNVKAILAEAGTGMGSGDQDYRLPERHEQFRRDERGLRHLLR